MAAPADERPTPGVGDSEVGSPLTESMQDWESTPTAALAPEGERPLTFAPQELVASRYRIVRFIARGGMGEVYEAEDLELAVRVALKTVRPDAEEKTQAVERFKREIQLARQVTHPNVCRIFDLARHTSGSPDGSIRDVLFLTMELLPGETLLDYIRRRGALGTAEALPLVEQFASALDAAHRVGVVHRDFKSSNVMLVRTAGGALRAVVTDFGLARGTAAANSDAAVTAKTTILGTPAYMAPEQVEGKPLTAAADIYALGIVVYEMVTGHRPFVADSSLAVAVKRLMELPPSPRVHVPNLDPVWESVILTCLRRDPSERFATAEDAARALRGERVTSTLGLVRGARGRRRVWLAAAAAALIASGIGYWTSQRARPQGSSGAEAPSAVTARARPVVAVLGFKDLGGKGDSAWLSAALSEMLATELNAGERIRVVGGENVSRMKIDLSLKEGEELARENLARVGGHLGADRVVVGSYLTIGQGGARRLRLDVRVQATSDGETLASFSETGSEADLFDVVSRAGSQLRTRLGAGELSASEAGALRASIPSSPKALRAYSEGLARLRAFDAVGARPLLEEAVRMEPAHPLFHAALAEAWSALGYDAKAKDEAKQAYDLSSGLSREERLAVEARYRETTKEWERAVEIHRTLWNFFPDNLEYGLRLASAEERAGQRKEALLTVEGLRKLPAPDGKDPRIDLAEARTAYRTSDFARQRSAADRAAVKAQARGARLLVAEARLSAGDATAALGDPDRAMALYEEAQGIDVAAGDRSGLARTLTAMANLRYRQGRLTEARGLFERSLSVSRETGNEFAVAWTLHSFANVLSDQGDLSGSLKVQEDALRIHRRIGDRGGEAGSLGNIASVLQYQGDLAGSRRLHEQALAVFRDVGEKGGAAIELNNIAIVLAAQGELKTAQAMFEQALAIKQETGNRSSIAFTLSDLGELFVCRGDLVQARQRHEEAARIREELGQKSRASESRLALAAVDLEEGRSAEAAAAAREAAELFRGEKKSELEGAARLLLARALLVGHDQEGAHQAIEQATPLLRVSQDAATRLALAIAGARVDGATGGAAAAGSLDRLAAASAAAVKMGHVGLELEARLAIAELEIRAGGLPARSRVLALQRDAKARGFGLIARKAAALP